MNEDANLGEYTKEEWWDVARAAKPGITEGEFDKMWDEFVKMQKAKKLY